MGTVCRLEHCELTLQKGEELSEIKAIALVVGAWLARRSA
jgi:hypothetical protein